MEKASDTGNIEGTGYMEEVMVNVFQLLDLKVSAEEVQPLVGLPEYVVIRELLHVKNSRSIKISEAWVNEIHKRFLQQWDLMAVKTPSLRERIFTGI